MLEVLLAAAPLFALLFALLLGHYPGCDSVLRLGERLRRPRRSRDFARRPAPSFSRSRPVVSGGLLLAYRLAQRPPPAAVTT